MEQLTERLYLNTESGLIYRALFSEPLRMVRCIGKTVQVENLEMNYVKIEGHYYEIKGYIQGLAILKPLCVLISDDEVFSCWDQMCTKLRSTLGEDLGEEIVVNMAYFGTSEFFGIPEEELKRRIK